MTDSHFNAHAFRAQFPVFSASENKELCYFDNAATTQKPQQVIDSISEFYTHLNGNAHRASHRLARAATHSQEHTRTLTANFLNAPASDNIVFCSGATAALNLLSSSLCSQLKPGDEIILSELEHHANLVPWQMAAERYQLKLRFLPLNQDLAIDTEELPSLLSERTKIVSLSGASNTLGSITDCQNIRDIIGSDICFIVDAAQLAAHKKIDVQALDCDFLCCSAHKLYAPSGLGILYGKTAQLEKLPPWQGGGEMILQVDYHRSSYNHAPHKFEAGTSALASIHGFGAALTFMSGYSTRQIEQHEQYLLTALFKGIESLPSVTLLSPQENNLGVAAFFTKEAGKNNELADFLDMNDIAIRNGHHCTQPLLKQLGHNGVLRASIAPYNTIEDTNVLLNAIEKWQAHDKLLVPAPAIQLTTNSDVPSTAKELSLESLETVFKAKNWQQRQKALLLWGNEIARKPELQKDECRIQGCESALWLQLEKIDGCYFFKLDSDARLIRGLAALTLSLVNGLNRAEIQSFDFEQAFAPLHLTQHLSPSRSNGIHALVQHLKDLTTEDNNVL